MKGCRIRAMQMSDVDAVRDIYNYYVQHTTVTFDMNPVNSGSLRRRLEPIIYSGLAFVAEYSGLTIGFCYAHPWKEKEAYAATLESTVYLHTAFTGTGLGTALMERLIDVCREKGVHVLVACITSPNESSEHLHQKLGFCRVSSFREVGRKFDRWLDISDYQKIL